jgi:transketolase
MSDQRFEDLAGLAARIRGKVLEMSHRKGTAHLAGALSCADVLAAAYGYVLRIDGSHPEDPDRDRFVFSKGHAVSALYATLAERGFFPPEELDAFNDDGGRFPEQPSPRSVPGVEVATGSLGHGLPVGLGMAIAARIADRAYRVYVLMSDGECQEGSVWEAAMMAPRHDLDRLCAIVDFNRWQATGRSNEVMAMEPLADKFASFGWSAHEVDGHDVGALADVLSRVPDGSGRPVAIVAHTVKGKGVSFIEDDNNWHYRVPTADELDAARAELGLVGS